MCVCTGTWAPTACWLWVQEHLWAAAFSADSTQGSGHLALVLKVLLSPSLHFLLVPFSGCWALPSPGTVPSMAEAGLCSVSALFNCTNHPLYHTPVLFTQKRQGSTADPIFPLGEWQKRLLSPCIVSIFVQFSTNATLITSYSNSIVRQNYSPPCHFSAYEHFLKNNDFVLQNVLWDEETS